jgi:c-di-GMP-related signal transduction protein
MDVFVARQPILDSARKLCGYELLFRSSLDNVFQAMDGDKATAELLGHSFVLIGKPKLTGKLRAHINFSAAMVQREVPKLVPADDIVVELLLQEPIAPAVVDRCRELVDAGYHLALDDYDGTQDVGELVELAHYVKVDVQALDAADIQRIGDSLRDRPVQIIAKRVESDAEFEQCREAGCSLFQGFFFARPQMVKGISPRSGRSMSMLALMAELGSAEFDLGRAQKLIRTDLALSYKLLRYINSAFFSLPREIRSISQAVMLLGSANVQRFVSIALLTQLGDNRPDEMLKLSILRARFCELMAPERADEAFTLGLFSVLDAIVDAPMATALEDLPLAGELRLALTENTGPLAAYLELARAYHDADWLTVGRLTRRLKLDESLLPGYYREAVGWADAMFDLDAP